MTLLSFIYFIFLPEPTLTLKVENISVDEGKIMIAVYDHKDHFMDESKMVMYRSVQVLNKGEVKIRLTLPEGDYAITVFHDVNDDDELNTNFVGIPTEPYGFSNNAHGIMGPPGYSSASFALMSDMRHVITLREL